MTTREPLYSPRHRIRFVTAASLFDGHDASINIIRRLLQQRGAEVVHLGHNRSVAEIVSAAIQEDAHAIAVSSYQGGHNEYFRYMVDLLAERDARHIKVFAGGGGVIVPREIRDLETYGVAKVYSPEDGRQMGLAGIISHMLETADFDQPALALNGDFSWLHTASVNQLARLVTLIEQSQNAEGELPPELLEALQEKARAASVPVLGITGTGGAGKSSLTDELIRRLMIDHPEIKVGVISVDPSKKKTGGALLGDRIRMNAIYRPNVYMRSLATRGSGTELSPATELAINALKAGSP